MLESTFKKGDKVVFTESPFPNPKLPEGIFTLGSKVETMSSATQTYWNMPYKGGTITVVEKWIKKAEDNE